MRERLRDAVAEIEHLCTRHRLLSRLSGKDRRRIARKMRLVSLTPLQRLYEVSGVITDVFFPLSAVLVFLGTTREGDVDMLGVTRQTADKLLTDFEDGKILGSRRGAVTIKDRSSLLDRACDCYHMIAKRLKALFTA